jgi:hypothetical protein
MKLKTVVFYQGVKLWDNNLYQTVQAGKNRQLTDVTIELKEHVVYVRSPDYDEVIIVGTSNMREARFVEIGGNEKDEKKKVETPEASAGKVVAGPIGQTAKQGFDPSKYAGQASAVKVTKPKAQKEVK